MSLPYFPMYPTDFEADTSHLTLAEDGAYNRLLRLMWMTPGCSLPDDDAWIMRRMRVSKQEFDDVVSGLIMEFFVRKSGRVTNKKLAEIYASTSEAHKKRVEAGKKGGSSKSLNKNNSKSSNDKAMPKQPEPEPEPDISNRDTNVSLVVLPDLKSAVSRFNDAAEKAGWPKVQKLTEVRSKHLRKRIQEAGGQEGWEVALRKAYDSDFLNGRTPKPFTGFSFDWLVNASNFTKIMEGNYDNRDRQTGYNEHGPRRTGNNFFDALSEVAAERSGRG